MDVISKYKDWINSPKMPIYLKEELLAMSKKAIDDAFYQDIDFGTAGMRGLLGAGTNKINIFTINKATVGFGNYLINNIKDAKTRGVVIAHDNRYMSREFTLEVSSILNQMGINTFIFPSLRPTPELSFAVRHLQNAGGIMITASHNPKEYNGFKVYDEFGAQLVPSKVEKLKFEIDKLPSFLDLDMQKADKIGVCTILDQEIDSIYINKVLDLQLHKDLRKDDFKIVYSPMHGCGSVFANQIFKDLGYDYFPVSSQFSVDPAFSNTKSPNPEEFVSYEEGIKIAKKVDADLVLITDPDADRLGLVFKNSNGEYIQLSGNQSAAILIDYILSIRKNRNLLTKNSVLYTTIVTSEFGSAIARSYGLKVKTFLTGFKFIGNEVQRQIDLKSDEVYEFGYEESYGLLVSPFVRDKDAFQALLLYAEMTNYYKKQGKTLDIVLNELLKKHGYYFDVTYSKMFVGVEGSKNMYLMLTHFRKTPLTIINSKKVTIIEDYLVSKRFIGAKEEVIDLPKSDVIKYFLEDGSSITIRPSGTEPKCKFYYCFISKESIKKAQEDALKTNQQLFEIIDQVFA